MAEWFPILCSFTLLSLDLFFTEGFFLGGVTFRFKIFPFSGHLLIRFVGLFFVGGLFLFGREIFCYLRASFFV